MGLQYHHELFVLPHCQQFDTVVPSVLGHGHRGSSLGLCAVGRAPRARSPYLAIASLLASSGQPQARWFTVDTASPPSRACSRVTAVPGWSPVPTAPADPRTSQWPHPRVQVAMCRCCNKARRARQRSGPPVLARPQHLYVRTGTTGWLTVRTVCRLAAQLPLPFPANRASRPDGLGAPTTHRRRFDQPAWRTRCTTAGAWHVVA
jgi:hypothetical protein